MICPKNVDNAYWCLIHCVMVIHDAVKNDNSQILSRIPFAPRKECYPKFVKLSITSCLICSNVFPSVPRVSAASTWGHTHPECPAVLRSCVTMQYIRNYRPPWLPSSSKKKPSCIIFYVTGRKTYRIPAVKSYWIRILMAFPPEGHQGQHILPSASDCGGRTEDCYSLLQAPHSHSWMQHSDVLCHCICPLTEVTAVFLGPSCVYFCKY